jgi:hypothetical protein
MKPILLILAACVAASTATAQLLPISAEERGISDIDRAAAASRYYGELYAQSLAALHGKIFGLDDATLKGVLEKLGQQQSESLLLLYAGSANGINEILTLGGSGVRAPVERTREWVWSGDSVTITPLPEPTPEEQ